MFRTLLVMMLLPRSSQCAKSAGPSWSPDNQDGREEVLGGILLLAEAALMPVHPGAGERQKCIADATAATVKSSSMIFICESMTQGPLRRTGNSR